MLYRIAKIICKYCIQIYYGKIEVNGLDQLPTDTPMLLACNHPTGFLEPIIIACILDRPLHFITRGDLFANKLLGPLLRGTNQIPIYRFKDGYAELKKNNDSIQAAEKALKGGGALLMFVEGKTEDIKMLKPLQKGMARISASLHKQGLTHCIVPVGVNFIDTVTFRSKVMLNFGTAIDPHSIIRKQDDERQFFKEINTVISEKMKAMMLHVADRSLHPLHDKLIDIYQATLRHDFLPRIDFNRNSFPNYKKVGSFLAAASHEEIKQIESELPSLDHKARHLLRKGHRSFYNYAMLILLGPIALLGVVVNAMPVFLGYLTERTLVKSREFVAPIRFSASMGFGLLWYGLLTILGLRTFGAWGLLVLLGPMLGQCSLYWLHLYMAVSKKYRLVDKSVDRLVAIFTLSKK